MYGPREVNRSNRFHKDASLEKKYHTITEDWIAKGNARKLSDEEASKCSPEPGIFPILQSPAATSQTKSGWSLMPPQNMEKHP